MVNSDCLEAEWRAVTPISAHPLGAPKMALGSGTQSSPGHRGGQFRALKQYWTQASAQLWFCDHYSLGMWG